MAPRRTKTISSPDPRHDSCRHVGVMSMQRIRNYGSSLQAYALARLIESVNDDVVVSFLDFRPGPTLVGDQAGAPDVSRLRRALSKYREYSAGDARLGDRLRFLNHKRTYPKHLAALGLDEAAATDLDVQVIGSDEVFNCLQANTNVGYSRDLFGHDRRAPRVISYAASFGNTTLERIQLAGIGDTVAGDLAEFDALSVRDRNSADIVNALTGRMPDIHADPVVVYDYLGEESGIPPERLAASPYVLVYGYSGRLRVDENDAIRSYARSIGAQVLCFGGVQGCGDRFIDCDPLELIAYFRDASAVVTDTFHGTILSIINNVPFATIVRPTEGDGYGNQEKIGFLLETFGLESRRVRHAERIADTLAEPVDATSTADTIRAERARTLSYLARETGARRATS